MASAYIAQRHRVYKNTLKQAVTLSDSVSLCHRHTVAEPRGVRPEAGNITCLDLLSSTLVYAMVKVNVTSVVEFLG